MSTLYDMFQNARVTRKAQFFPYICVGYPDLASSIRFADAALAAGASGLELGVPFSDPISDGPTLQKATHQALLGGVRFLDVFRVVKALRANGHTQPLLVMTYLNPVLQMGWEEFAKEMALTGADGAIIPDLPLEEFTQPQSILAKKGLVLIPFLAPTSSPERVKRVDALGAPFIYYVAVTGVTGARSALPPDLLKNLRHLRGVLKTPLTVGFGISNPVQAAQVGKEAEGVIIASALINLIEKTPKAQKVKAVETFCGAVVKALRA
jgi:tryptophan synthase alpha chain